jgi:hypothetical protein
VFDLGDPLWDQRKAVLPQRQQLAAQSFCVGCQHSRRHEACGFIPIAADHADCMATTGQLMGDRQAHQPSAQHDNRWWCGPWLPAQRFETAVQQTVQAAVRN